jgi:hypothetical protein
MPGGLVAIFCSWLFKAYMKGLSPVTVENNTICVIAYLLTNESQVNKRREVDPTENKNYQELEILWQREFLLQYRLSCF